MKEADVRRAIGLDTTLTTAQKYTLIMLLTRLDWETWTGQVSAHDLATISTQADRQVKRHIAALKRAGWIDRMVWAAQLCGDGIPLRSSIGKAHSCVGRKRKRGGSKEEPSKMVQMCHSQTRLSPSVRPSSTPQTV